MNQHSEAHLLQGAAYFPVHDVSGATRYYENVLGFRCEYSAGDPAEFSILIRDDQRIMLKRVSQVEKVTPNEGQGGTWDVFYWTDDVQSLHDELVSRNADVVYGPIDQDRYGMREFAVRDLAGYVLGFGQPL